MTLALKAMDVLVSLRSQEAADALGVIGASRDDARKAKEARRALHKLSLSGLKAAPVVAPPRAEPEPDRIYACMVSPVDGAGSHSVTVARQNRFGTLRLGVFMLNETLGVTDAYGADPCSMSLWKRYLAESNEHPQKLVPVELAFAQAQIEVAAARNERSHTPLPERYYYFASLASGASELRQRPPELAADAVQANPDLLAKSADLLSQPECDTWFFDPDDVHPYVLKIVAEARRRQKEKGSNDLPVLDLAEVQQEGAIISTAINALFDGARRATFQAAGVYGGYPVAIGAHGAGAVGYGGSAGAGTGEHASHRPASVCAATDGSESEGSAGDGDGNRQRCSERTGREQQRRVQDRDTGRVCGRAGVGQAQERADSTTLVAGHMQRG